MVTNKKNFTYYFNIFATPAYLMRHTLEEDYSIIALGGGCSFAYLSMVADLLTAYNEIAFSPVFFRIEHFKLN